MSDPQQSSAHFSLQELSHITPVDSMEYADIQRAQRLAQTGAPLCRTHAPDHPNPHLVSYFPVVDPDAQALLLGAHRKSGLWLPPGGHVEPGEHPRDTVRRECVEELRMPADFLHPAPLFVTITRTRGAYPHEDISLWYPLRGHVGRVPDYDPSEYSDMRWFALAHLPLAQSDPQLHRFVTKVFSALHTDPKTPLPKAP